MRYSLIATFLIACVQSPPTDAERVALACADVADAACSSAATCPNPKYQPADVYRLCAANVVTRCEEHAIDDVETCEGDAWTIATCAADGEVVFDRDSAACLALVTR